MILQLLMAAALAAGAAAEKPKPEKPPVKVVCRDETTTGTLIPRRVCRKVSTMERQSEEAREYIRDTQSRPQVPECNPAQVGC